MKPKSTGNKAEKYNEAEYFNRQAPKDKAKKSRIAELYKDQTLPKRHGKVYRGK